MRASDVFAFVFGSVARGMCRLRPANGANLKCGLGTLKGIIGRVALLCESYGRGRAAQRCGTAGKRGDHSQAVSHSSREACKKPACEKLLAPRGGTAPR